MKASKCVTALLLLATAATATVAGEAQPTTQPTEKATVKTVRSEYPNLASSGLTYAAIANLPDGVLLESGDLKITDKDLEQEIAKAPKALREQLRKNAFFLLEQMATSRLILAEAKLALQNAGKDLGGLSERQIIGQHLQSAANGAKVTDEQVKAFYEENKDMVGGATFEQVKDQIRQYLLGQKKQEAVNEHIETLGKRTKIEVAAGWTKQQASLAADNPVDKARNSGKPSLVDFGADGCRPCDMLAPILKTLKKKYDGKANVLFVSVRDEQVLAARYGIQSIPVQIFFDKDGKEVFRHVGFFPQDKIEEKLKEMGIK